MGKIVVLMYCLVVLMSGREVGHSKVSKSWKTLRGACKNAYLLLQEDPTLLVQVVKVGRPDEWSINFYMTKYFENYTGVVFGHYVDEKGYSHNTKAVIIIKNDNKIHSCTVPYQFLYLWEFDSKLNDLVQLRSLKKL